MTTQNKEPGKKDIWCCSCGDRTCYATAENRSIAWGKTDKSLGIGVCKPCAKDMTPEAVDKLLKEACCAPQD